MTTYRHGDFKRRCDRSGFRVHASDTRKEWNGLIVDKRFWEPRHPQDYVKGVKDDQSVPEARPWSATYSQSETTLDADELPGQTVISVASTSDMTIGDSVVVFLDNDETHLSTIDSFSDGDTVTLVTAIPSKASSGNRFIINSNPVSASDL